MLHADDHPYAWLQSLENPAPAPEVKTLAKMPQPGYGGGGAFQVWGPGGTFGLDLRAPGAKKDYAREASDLWRNSTVAVCLGWLQDNFGTAKLQVCKRGDKKAGIPDEPIPDHPLSVLLNTRPNSGMTPAELFDLCILTHKCDGNTYLVKARKVFDDAPGELWWVPPDMIWPRWNVGSDRFIEWYDYMPDSRLFRLEPADVVHIRAMPDPYWYGRKGIARLKHIVRSVVGVNRAESYTAGIIANGGIGKAFIPDSAGEVYDETDAEAIKERMSRSRDDNAGDVTVLSTSGTVVDVGSTPEEMMLDRILDRPEANICAALGVPPMVVGLAVGDATRTFSNLAEAEKQAWHNGLIPMQDRFAQALGMQLLPDFDGFDGLASDQLVLKWDRSEVEALSEDKTEKVNRGVSLWTAGLLPQNRCLAEAGESPVEGGDDRYYSDLMAPGPEAQPTEETDLEAEDDDEGSVKTLGRRRGTAHGRRLRRSGRVTRRWDAEKHPRGEDGRFVESPEFRQALARGIRKRRAKAQAWLKRRDAEAPHRHAARLEKLDRQHAEALDKARPALLAKGHSLAEVDAWEQKQRADLQEYKQRITREHPLEEFVARINRRRQARNYPRFWAARKRDERRLEALRDKLADLQAAGRLTRDEARARLVRAWATHRRRYEDVVDFTVGRDGPAVKTDHGKHKHTEKAAANSRPNFSSNDSVSSAIGLASRSGFPGTPFYQNP